MRRFGVTLRNLGNSIFLIDFARHSEGEVARFTFSRGWAHLAMLLPPEISTVQRLIP